MGMSVSVTTVQDSKLRTNEKTVASLFKEIFSSCSSFSLKNGGSVKSNLKKNI